MLSSVAFSQWERIIYEVIERNIIYHYLALTYMQVNTKPILLFTRPENNKLK